MWQHSHFCLFHQINQINPPATALLSSHANAGLRLGWRTHQSWKGCWGRSSSSYCHHHIVILLSSYSHIVIIIISSSIPKPVPILERLVRSNLWFSENVSFLPLALGSSSYCPHRIVIITISSSHHEGNWDQIWRWEQAAQESSAPSWLATLLSYGATLQASSKNIFKISEKVSW